MLLSYLAVRHVVFSQHREDAISKKIDTNGCKLPCAILLRCEFITRWSVSPPSRLVSVVLKKSRLVGELWSSILSRSNWTHCCQSHTAAAMFLRSCFAQALSRGDGAPSLVTRFGGIPRVQRTFDLSSPSHLGSDVDVVRKRGSPSFAGPQIIQQTPVDHELGHDVNRFAWNLKSYQINKKRKKSKVDHESPMEYHYPIHRYSTWRNSYRR